MADNNNLKNALQALTSKIERNFQYLKNLVSSYVEYDDTDIQTAVQNLDDNKVDKITGKALSSNDFTNAYKSKLDNLSNYDDSELRQLIGTKQASGDYVTTSDLNQRGFLTEHQSLDNYYTKTAADSKFLTEHQSLSDYYTKTQIDNKGYLTQHQDISEKANLSDLAAVAMTGSYNDLNNKPTIPTIPTTLSSFTDNLGSNPVHTHSQYLTQHQDITAKENSSNKVTSLSASSTDAQYPSAKCVYDLVGDVESALQAINSGNSSVSVVDSGGSTSGGSIDGSDDGW